MKTRKRPDLAPGQNPWDSANGFRIGALVGALVGAGLGLVTSFVGPWVIGGGAVVGGAVGYWSEKRKM